MDCRAVNNLISAYLDGALSIDEQVAFNEHLSNCPHCAREMELSQKISCALRDIGREEITSPPELTGLVMANLREERRSKQAWLPATWQKAVAAAAAAALIIAGGSTAAMNLLPKAAIVAEIPGSSEPVVTLVENPTVNITELPASSEVETGNAETASEPKSNEQEIEPVAGEAGIAPPAANTSAPDNKPEAPDNSGGLQVAANLPAGEADPYASRALLSSGEKVVSSTLLKVTAADLTGTKAAAVNLAAGAGAATQVFPEQNGDKNVVVLRMTVDSRQASGLASELADLGALVDRKDESSDITANYNETLVHYRDLQAQLSVSSNQGERLQLESQAASYRQQLETWDTESGKQVITLWLEN